MNEMGRRRRRLVVLFCVLGAAFFLSTALLCHPHVEAFLLCLGVRDEAALATMALEHHKWDVRLRAAGKLTDPSLLVEVAVGSAGDVGCAAVGRLNDQESLVRIALEGSDGDVRELALSRITEPSLLARIAMEGSDEPLGKTAVTRLKDQSLLAKIAMDGRGETVRSEAVNGIAEQPLLAEIALKSQDWAVCEAAASRVTDQVLLARIAVESEVSGVQQVAVIAVGDGKSLAQQMDSVVDPMIRRDIELLQKVLSACETLPSEHRCRLAGHVLDVVRDLIRYEDVVGRPVRIATLWRQIGYHDYALYREGRTESGASTHRQDGTLNVTGESFAITVQYSAKAGEFRHLWFTQFPPVVYGHQPTFWPAHINCDDLVKKVVDAD
jgi:hypothetical protein